MNVNEPESFEEYRLQCYLHCGGRAAGAFVYIFERRIYRSCCFVFFKFHQRQIAWLVRSSALCYSKLTANSITLSAVLEERCQKKKKIYRRGLLFECRLLHPYTQGTKASVEEVYFFYRHARPPWPPPKNDAWSSLIVGCRAFQLVRLFWKTKAKPRIAHAQNLNDVVIIFS